MKKIIYILLVLLFAGYGWAAVYVKDVIGYGVYYQDGATACSQVDENDTSGDLETALNAAGEGGTLYICTGTYTDTEIDDDNKLELTHNNQTIESVDGSVSIVSTTDHAFSTNAKDGLAMNGPITLTGSASGKNSAQITTNSNDLSFTDVSFSGSGQRGVYINPATYNLTFTDCNASSNGTAEGIWIQANATGNVYGIDILGDNSGSCVLSSNGGDGIRVSSDNSGTNYVYDLTIEGCDFESNTGAGIRIRYLKADSGENLIRFNSVNYNSTGGTLGGIWIGDSVNVIAEKNDIDDNHTNGIDGRGLYCDESSVNCIFRYNVVSNHDDNSTPNSQSSGIAVTNSSATIHHNLLYGNDAGITIGGTSTSVLLYNNTIVNNDDRGVSIQSSQDSTEVTARNNIIVGHVTGWHDDSALVDADEDYTVWYDNTADVSDHTKGSNAFNSDPALLSDYRPPITSPACDVADDSIGAAYAIDLDGHDQRRYGSDWDIGAYVCRNQGLRYGGE